MADAFDLIVVGSGSGNSIPEFLNDRRIALVERDPQFGGTCLNRGCIPSKMFVLPADVAVEAGESGRLGISTSFDGADWAAIRDRIFGRIDKISAGGRVYRATGSEQLTLIEGTARFVDEKILDVDGRLITAPDIIVATGSRPTIPDIAGLADSGYHTSDSIMRLETFPERLGIIGGGFIAVEMGHVFSGLGSEVTLFNRSGALIRQHDHDISERFTEVFGGRVELRLNTLPDSVRRVDDGIELRTGAEVLIVDELLVATGRRPNSDLIDAVEGGLAVDNEGVIVVDEHLRTTVDGVWALGDVANEFQLKHVANAEAKVAFWNVAYPERLHSIDYKAVPSAVFSNPQVASVGFTEQQARDAGIDIVVGRRDYAGVAYGWALVDETSFCKVIIDRESGLLVGGHVLGPQAATLIQPLIQAMQFDRTAAEMAHDQYWIHPALTEVVENAIIDALEQMT